MRGGVQLGFTTDPNIFGLLWKVHENIAFYQIVGIAYILNCISSFYKESKKKQISKLISLFFLQVP